MTGLAYEYAVAKYLQSIGYTNVSVTKGSGDYGIDVIAHKDGHKYAVQCKYYSSPVSLSAVQEAVAGMAMYGCDRAMVVTNSTYTKAAQELAYRNNVTLLSNIVPVSRPINNNTEPKRDITYTIIVIALVVAHIILSVALIVLLVIFAPKMPLDLILISCSASFIYITIPIWTILAYKGIKKLINHCKTDKSKKVYFVVAKKVDSYRQSDKRYKKLDASLITGLPHKFTIAGKSYDIDKLSDIEQMPLNFSSFYVNCTKYYFNNYFRLCAKLYKQAGYTDFAKALKKKASELENDPLHGRFMRKQAKTIIKSPKEISERMCEFYDSLNKDTSEYKPPSPSEFNTCTNKVSAEISTLQKLSTIKEIIREIYPEATEVQIENLYNCEKISSSILQRKLYCGYADAAHILDSLAENNIIMMIEKYNYIWL